MGSRIGGLLSNIGDRMVEELAIQREVVLRWLDRYFAAVLFLERRLEAVFIMIGNLPWAIARSSVANQKLSGPPATYAHLAAGVASKSVKLQRPARATVCSHSARDATASVEDR